MASCGSGFVGSMCALFVPSEGIGVRVDGLRTTLESKFPFSLAADLGGFFTGSVGGGALLPDQLGWIPLPLADLGGFFLIAKTAITLLIVVGFTWWLIDRLTPQVTI